MYSFIGKKDKICIVIDNAKWHSQLTNASKISLRPWNKNQIRQWLIDHSVPFIEQYSKSELLELIYTYAPEKKIYCR